MKAFFLLVVAGSGLLVAVAASQQPPPAQHEAPANVQSRMKWYEYVSLAELINSCKPWTAGSPSSKDDWISITRVAQVFQTLRREDIEAALNVYMVLASRNHFGEGDWTVNFTKPMLLLRVMFDIPDTAIMQRTDNLQHVGPCGWFAWEPAKQGQPLSQMFGLPISWTSEGPRCIAKPMYTKFIPQRPYQPHIEYLYFRSKFPLRANLEEYSGKKFDSWIELRNHLR